MSSRVFILTIVSVAVFCLLGGWMFSQWREDRPEGAPAVGKSENPGESAKSRVRVPVTDPEPTRVRATVVPELLRGLGIEELTAANREGSLPELDLAGIKGAIKQATPEEMEAIIRWARRTARESGIPYVILHETLAVWSEVDPQAAIEALLKDTPGVDEEWLGFGLPVAAKAWARRDAEEAWRALNGEGLLEGRDELEHELFTNWAEQSPETAAETIRELASKRDLPHGGQVGAVVANKLWNQNPGRAMDWVLELPNDRPVAGQAMSAVMGRWLEEMPQEASQWLLNLQPSSARDAAIMALVGVFQDEDPESAAFWAAEISSGASRKLELLKSLRSWQRRDKLAVEHFLSDRTRFSAAEAEELRTTLDPPRTLTSFERQDED